jgi:hypothetical protein
MGRVAIFVLVLATISLVAKAIAIGIVLLVVAGLIFRTKETIGLLLLSGVFAAFQAYPIMTTCIVGGLVALGLYTKNKEGQISHRDDQL